MNRMATRELSAGEITIRPALVRAGAPAYDQAWLVKVTYLLATVNPAMTEGVPLEFSAVWAPALIQHYGPGSYFIDVTFDLSTALWFARHTWNQRWMCLAAGDDDRGIYDTWISTAWYTGRGGDTGHPAVLYVLDLPEWNGVIVPTKPCIVDLTHSPIGEWLTANAGRISAQHAGLVHARWLPGGDIGPLVRGWIELDANFEMASQEADRPTCRVFPPPADDLVYALLLQLPQQIRFSQLDSRTPSMCPGI